MRAVPSEFRGEPNTADTARTVFSQLQTANHRWTGAEIGAGGRGETGAESRGGILPGAAGLYTSLFSDALYNEVRWYSRYQTIVNPFTGAEETTHWQYRQLPGGKIEVDVRPPQQLLDALTDKRVFVYTLNESIEVADFDVDSTAFQAWLQRIHADPSVQRALELASLACDYQLVNAVDYSTSRALGNFALRDLGMSGLVVSTSRDDHPKWVFSPIFLALFTLPYKTPIDLPASLSTAWPAFLNDLSRLAALVSKTCRPSFVSRGKRQRYIPPTEKFLGASLVDSRRPQWA